MMDVVVAPQSEEYRVDLNVFHGPLDLLLYLIKKEEVDICDIPIARITRQYLKYIEMMKVLSLEVAGEFILMAATLIHIKARLLLPRGENDSEEADPREELIMALIEYKKFKLAGEILRENALLEERNYVPPSPVGKVGGYIPELPDANLFDLIAAFNGVRYGRPQSPGARQLYRAVRRPSQADCGRSDIHSASGIDAKQTYHYLPIATLCRRSRLSW